MEVKLISKTIGVAEYENRSIDEIIVGQARVSSGRETENLFDEPEKLLRHCILNQHWSIFELANLGFSIKTSRAMGRELLRHCKHVGVTEHCITGDSMVSFISPSGRPYKISIKDIYNRWHFGSKPILKKGKNINLEILIDNKIYSTQELYKLGLNKSTLRSKAINKEIPFEKKKNIYNNNCYYFLGSDIKSMYNTDRSIVFNLHQKMSKLRIKSYDIKKNEFTTTKIKQVFFNGIKPVYKITLESGKYIKSTKEHKFFNGKEYLPLEEIVSLKINIDSSVKYFENNYIARNGIPLHQDKNQLLEAKKESIENKLGIPYIAKKFNISYHTVRKWLKIHKIQFQKKEVSLTFDVWNKNKSGYKLKPRSIESRIEQSLRTPKGEYHHSYKGGSKDMNERSLIQKYINSKRTLIYEMNGGMFCSKCKLETSKLDLHHIEEVTRSPHKAYNINNIMPLCKKCHKETHKYLSTIPHEKIYNLKNYDWKSIRPSNNKNTKKTQIKNTYKLEKIVNIEFLGFEECYDLETVSEDHNYIANNILVHNSQRYSSEISLEEIDIREQSKSNRQSSKNSIDPIINFDGLLGKSSDWIKGLTTETSLLYKHLIKNDVAKETARFILPECTQTHLYMNFRIRELITFLNARLHKTAQKEIRLIAEEIRDIFMKECPIISKALFNFDNAYNIHITERIVLEKYKVYDKI